MWFDRNELSVFIKNFSCLSHQMHNRNKCHVFAYKCKKKNHWTFMVEQDAQAWYAKKKANSNGCSFKSLWSIFFFFFFCYCVWTIVQLKMQIYAYSTWLIVMQQHFKIFFFIFGFSLRFVTTSSNRRFYFMFNFSNKFTLYRSIAFTQI